MKKTNPFLFWYRRFKLDFYTFFYAITDPNLPAHFKIMPLLIFLAYLLFPVDLIPDFIPFLGYIDDIILIPIGLVFIFQILPEKVIENSRKRAKKKTQQPSYFFESILLLGALFLFTILAGIIYFFIQTL